jgi:signal transduction histidine kinase
VATGETTLSASHDPSEEAERILIHDFRNLLAVIINYSELIAEETGDPEAVRADIGEVRAAAERAIVLTEKLRRPAKPTLAQGDAPPDVSTS